MKANVYSSAGKKTGSVELPEVFKTVYRPDLIKRTFWAEQSHLFQPKGADPRAGLKTSAANWGTGAGTARIPKNKAGPFRSTRTAKGQWYRSKGRWFPAAGVARIVPQARKGRQAHPPKSWENIIEKVNAKEAKLALNSAIAATASKEMVIARGHKADKVETFPIVADDLSKVLKTKEARAFLEALGLELEMERVAKRKVRAGKGTKRSRRYRLKKGPVIIMSKDNKSKAFRNMRGVDAITADKLNVSIMAPGTAAGRLAIFEKKALEEINGSI